MTDTETTLVNRARQPKADVLIVTVTKVEAQAVLETFRLATGHAAQLHHVGVKTYFELGTIRDAHIFMVQSAMGVGGPDGAVLTVDEAIRVLSPSSVIMVGIAFGFDDKEFQIGDVLVSRQLMGYELQKIVTTNESLEEITPRADRPHASPRLLSRFESSSLNWHEFQVGVGLILSGEKLIDNRAFRNRLRKLAPEALGGEMEGFGLYSAAFLRKTDWILVKAICDWADGDKENNKALRQKLAAENASRFTIYILQQGGFVEDIDSSSSQKTNQVEQGARQSARGSIGTHLYTYDIHASWVIGVDWAPNGAYIASAGGDGTVRVWEADTGYTLITYRGHTTPFAKINIQPIVYTIAWSPDGLCIASGADGAKVHVWNAVTGQTLSIYNGHSGLWSNVFALAWSSDGTRIASACSSISMDKTIHIWDVASERAIKKYNAGYGLLPNFGVLSVVWSPDDTHIAADTFGDRAIRIWNVTTERQVSIISTDAGSISHLAWSPDGTRLASAHSKHIAQIWDILTGACIAILRGHTDSVRCVAWSPDSTRLATASNDRTVRLWDAATGHHIYTYHGHSHWTTSAAWSPDGARLASASNDKTVQIWQAQD